MHCKEIDVCSIPYLFLDRCLFQYNIPNCEDVRFHVQYLDHIWRGPDCLFLDQVCNLYSSWIYSQYCYNSNNCRCCCYYYCMYSKNKMMNSSRTWQLPLYQYYCQYRPWWTHVPSYFLLDRFVPRLMKRHCFSFCCPLDVMIATQNRCPFYVVFQYNNNRNVLCWYRIIRWIELLIWSGCLHIQNKTMQQSIYIQQPMTFTH